MKEKQKQELADLEFDSKKESAKEDFDKACDFIEAMLVLLRLIQKDIDESINSGADDNIHP